MARIIVGVLRGGSSPEYQFSLKSGAAMLDALSPEKYDVRDIFIDKSGLWHSRGKPTEPGHVLSQIDLVVNALHGGRGEDGTVQRILESAGVPYIGSSPSASFAAHNKFQTHHMLSGAGIPVPMSMGFTLEDKRDTGMMANEVFSYFGPPYVVKPVSEGSGHGIRVAKTILELPNAIADVLDDHGAALVQEFLLGDEVVVGLIEGFRNTPLYALPPALVQRPKNYIYNPEEHFVGVQHAIPSPFSFDQKDQLMDTAKRAHQALGLSHHSDVDIILTRRGPVVMELNSVPHFHAQSPFNKGLYAVGSDLREYVDHLIEQVRR